MDDEDLRVRIDPNNPSAGSVSSSLPYGLDDFSPEQLAIILQGVSASGVRLATYLSDATGRDITPQEAFQSIFGDVEFGYDPNRPNTGVTIRTGDPTILSNPIYILLDDDSFPDTISGAQSFGVLPDDFVVLHELGHAFQNRYGDFQYDISSIAGVSYVNASGGFWSPDGRETTRSNIPGYGDLTPSVVDGQQRVDSQGRPLYSPPAGLYVYGERSGVETGYFPNETRDEPNPSEGFSDTFANFFLDASVIPDGRLNYFTDNISDWLLEIYCRNGECDEP